MLNQVVLVGRVFAIEDGAITIKIPRVGSEKDEVDFLTVRVEGTLNTSIQEMCHVDDIIGIKARVENDDEGMYLKGEKATFLTSKN